LTNVARHSKATYVELAMQLNDGELQIEIADNGKGVDPAMLVHPESLGILSMQERARMLGGEVIITGNPGKGTRVILRAPLHSKSNQSLEESSSL
jgi:signal transduction histidine kinase